MQRKKINQNLQPSAWKTKGSWDLGLHQSIQQTFLRFHFVISKQWNKNEEDETSQFEKKNTTKKMLHKAQTCAFSVSARREKEQCPVGCRLWWSPCCLTAPVSNLRVMKRLEKGKQRKPRFSSCDLLLLRDLWPYERQFVRDPWSLSVKLLLESLHKHTLSHTHTEGVCYLGDWLCSLSLIMGKMEIQKTIISLRGSSSHLRRAFRSIHVILPLPLKYLECKDGLPEHEACCTRRGWNRGRTWRALISVALLLCKGTRYTCRLEIPRWFAFLFDFNIFFRGDGFQI